MSVHPDWHLATWARGSAGKAMLQDLLADQRLQKRLQLIATRGRELPNLDELGDGIRNVLQWFNNEPAAVIFRQLGVLRHASAWGTSLATSGGKSIPAWVTLDEIKRGLKALHTLPEAVGLRASRPVSGPDDLLTEGKGLIAGWWAAFDPELAADLAYLCPVDLSADLPEPPVSAELCAQAVAAAAVNETAPAQATAFDPGLAEVVPDGGFDD